MPVKAPHYHDTLVRLASAAGVMAKLKRGHLDQMKTRATDLDREDFLWHALIEGFATLGGVSGWQGLIETQSNYERITFDAISAEHPEHRQKHAVGVLRDAGVRYPERKAKWVVGCFDRIISLGGLLAAKIAMESCDGRDGKIRFLKLFPGVGDKYARNMLMTVYHPDFRNSIAIDSRIIKISAAWALDFPDYEQHELFYLSVADSAGLNGWELDRLMFWYTTVFLPPIEIVG